MIDRFRVGASAIELCGFRFSPLCSGVVIHGGYVTDFSDLFVNTKIYAEFSLLTVDLLNAGIIDEILKFDVMDVTIHFPEDVNGIAEFITVATVPKSISKGLTVFSYLEEEA